MKKLITLWMVFILGINTISAVQVSQAIAKTVAENFYKRTALVANPFATLVHTELSSTGLPVYYVFDITNKNGFVIVTAESAARPIIGYSTEKHFTQPNQQLDIG